MPIWDIPVVEESDEDEKRDGNEADEDSLTNNSKLHLPLIL